MTDENAQADDQGGEFTPYGANNFITEHEDGSATVRFDDDADKVAAHPEHFGNLALTLPMVALSDFAVAMMENVELDKKSREKRDKQYEEGLKRTGLGNDAPGGAQFEGASRTVHPVLIEATVDFASRAMKELMPSSGPVKEHIPGKVTAAKLEKARRKAAHLNWQLTKQMEEFYAEMEQLVTQLPLGGVGYMKYGWDPDKRRPVAMFIPVDKMLIPFAASSFYTAERKTHMVDITFEELRRRMKSGQYRDLDLASVPQAPERTRPEVANDKIEGREDTGYNEDGLRAVPDIYVRWDFGAGDGFAPYIVSVDENTKEVLAVYRNWLETDADKNELPWVVEWPFVPWRGAYPIGLIHMIGSLAGGATGAIRALLDAAYINNMPGGVKLKGGTRGGQNVRVAPTQITEIEGSGSGMDDVRKTFMPYPFNAPSPVLLSLLGVMVDSAKGVIRTTFEDLPATAGANLPVGTMLAAIEQGAVVFSAIHGRLHKAMAKSLEVISRINRMYLEEDELKDDAGELLAYRQDYEGPDDVVPVSDPNIFSDVQRTAQMQVVAQRADLHPELYDGHAVETMILERTKLPNFEKLLRPVPKPMPMNAISENVSATMGRPVMAFPHQDHIAHLQAHLDYMASPDFGMNIVIAPQFLPVMLSHIKEHLALWYAGAMYSLLQEATGVSPEQLIDEDPEASADLDRLIAAASKHLMPQIKDAFTEVPTVVAQAIKLLQTLAPPPMDPQAQAQAAETARRAQADKDKQAIEGAKVVNLADERKSRERKDAVELELEQRRIEGDVAVRREAIAHEDLRNAEDNRTAQELALMEVATNEHTGLSTGHGINPQP